MLRAPDPALRAGGYELCPVCHWEDDGSQLRWPMSTEGANGISLMEAQRTHQRISALGRLRGHPQAELNVALTARLMSDPSWLHRHPFPALGLAWRHRQAQSPLRTLKQLHRRRFAG